VGILAAVVLRIEGQLSSTKRRNVAEAYERPLPRVNSYTD